MRRAPSLAMFLFAAAIALLSAAPAIAQNLPDILVMTDGTTVRGTVLESRPDVEVVFMNYDGETIVVPWEEVEYAGAADGVTQSDAEDDKPMGQSAASGSGEEIRVEFTSDVSPMRYSYVSSIMTAVSSTGATAVGITMSPLCSAPCTMLLPRNEYRMVGNYRNRNPAGAMGGEPLLLNQDSTVHGEYVSRRRARTLSVLFGVTGAIATGIGAYPFGKGEYGIGQYTSGNIALMSAGGALAIGGWIGYIASPDRIRYSVTPL